MIKHYQNRFTKAFVSFLLILAMLTAFVPVGVFAENLTITHLAFTSDVHNIPEYNDQQEKNLYANVSATRLENWLNGVSAQKKCTFDTIGITGDFGSAKSETGNLYYWTAVGKVLDTIRNNENVNSGVYTNGNHESFVPGSLELPHTDYEQYAGEFTLLGEAKRTENYAMFCIGANETEEQSFRQEDISVLSDYLDECEEDVEKKDVPIFVLSHYPLHEFGSRSVKNASSLIGVLNAHPDLDIVFIWGHNHTLSDTHYGQVFTENLEGTYINFTYASAGCMNDYEHNGSGISAKGLTVDINDDHSLTFTYYDVYSKALSQTIVKNDRAMEQEIEGKTEYVSYKLEAGRKYVIAAEGYALTNESDEGYITQNNGRRKYTGFQGKAITTAGKYIVDPDLSDDAAVVDDSMLWEAVEINDGFAFRNTLTKKYLLSTYINTETEGFASISKLEGVEEIGSVWELTSDGKLSTDNKRYLAFDIENKDVDGTIETKNTANIFTIRGSGAADNITFYTDPQIKNDCQEVSSFENHESYIITLNEGKALCVDSDNKFVIGTVPKTIGEDNRQQNSALIWKAETPERFENSGSFTLENESTGLYLNAKYKKENNTVTVRELYLGEEPQVWKLTDKGLQHNGSGKYLAFDDDNNPASFTVKSENTWAKTIRIFKVPYKNAENGLCRVNELKDGKKFIITAEQFALTNNTHPGYVATNSSGIYRYQGLCGESFSTTEKEKQVSEFDMANVWQAEKVGDYPGFALKNVATDKYLNSSSKLNGDGNGTDSNVFLGEKKECWIYDNGILRQTVDTQKYLNYEKNGDNSGITGEMNLFTLRSDPLDKITLYQVGDNVKDINYLNRKYYTAKLVPHGDMNIISMAGYYLIVDRDQGLVLTNQYHDGFMFTNNDQQYAGLQLKDISVESGKQSITTGIDESMIWHVERSGSNFSIKTKDQSKELTGGRTLSDGYCIKIVDTEDLDQNQKNQSWTYDKVNNKRMLRIKIGTNTRALKCQTGVTGIYDGGSSDHLATLRGGTDGDEYFFFKVTEYDCMVFDYQAGKGGKVSRSRDIKNSIASEIIGSTAIADPGYKFKNWIDEKGNIVSLDPNYVPDESKESGIYTAVFEPKVVTLEYQVVGEGEICLLSNKHEYSVDTKEELLTDAAEGKATGAVAKPKNGSKFIGWSTDQEGANIISIEAEFIPVGPFISEDEGNKITYYAQFMSCYGYVRSELTSGHANLKFGEYEFKDYILDNISNAWTIFDTAQNQYVGFSNGKVVFQDDFYLWQYDGGFYTQGKRSVYRQLLSLIKSLLNISEKEPAQYYLTAEPGRLTVTTEPQDVIFFMEYANREHSEGEDGICTVCGYDPKVPGGVKEVRVNVSTEVNNQRILLINVPIRRNTIEIKVNAVNVLVDKIEYRTSASGQWKTGSTFTSLFGIRNLYIRITDAKGQETNWHYDGESTQRID